MREEQWDCVRIRRLRMGVVQNKRTVAGDIELHQEVMEGIIQAFLSVLMSMVSIYFGGPMVTTHFLRLPIVLIPPELGQLLDTRYLGSLGPIALTEVGLFLWISCQG